MRKIEFETTVKDGIIKIPNKFKNIWDTKIKVIIMKEELKKNKRKELIRLFRKASDKDFFKN